MQTFCMFYENMWDIRLGLLLLALNGYFNFFLKDSFNISVSVSCALNISVSCTVKYENRELECACKVRFSSFMA
jgi:hypothetical protein